MSLDKKTIKIIHTYQGTKEIPVNRYCLHSNIGEIGCIETMVSQPSWISYLRIKKDHRHQGYGTALVNHVSKFSNILQVVSSPRAVPFYEKIGFRAVTGVYNRYVKGLEYCVTHYRKEK